MISFGLENGMSNGFQTRSSARRDDGDSFSKVVQVTERVCVPYYGIPPMKIHIH